MFTFGRRGIEQFDAIAGNWTKRYVCVRISLMTMGAMRARDRLRRASRRPARWRAISRRRRAPASVPGFIGTSEKP